MVRKQQLKHESKSGRSRNQRRNTNDNLEEFNSKGPVVVDDNNSRASSSSNSNDYHQYRNITEQLGSIGLCIRKVDGDGYTFYDFY